MATRKHTSCRWDSQQERELDHWPGVRWSRVGTRKHNRLVVEFKGQSRFIVYPASPTASPSAFRNHLSDMRRELRALGAERVKEKA